MITLNQGQRSSCGCLLLAALLIAFTGCVLLMHLRAGADVAAVNSEPADVTKAVIEGFGKTTNNQGETEIRK